MGADLRGTVAVVTGASSGIGAATARELASLGAAVAVVARREDRLDTLVADIETTGGIALAVQADISDRIQANAVIQSVIDLYGRLESSPTTPGSCSWAQSAAPTSRAESG